MTTQVKAVDQSFRKKWNKAEFEALAAVRAANSGVLPDERVVKPIIYEQDRGTSEARSKSLALDVMVGTHVQVEDIKRSGFYCAKCDRSEKDSGAWLDHLNSVQHQRLVGGSLAAERSTVDDVRDHLRHLKRKQLEVVETDEDFDFEEKLRLLKQSEEQRKAEKRLRRKMVKKARKAGDSGPSAFSKSLLPRGGGASVKQESNVADNDDDDDDADDGEDAKGSGMSRASDTAQSDVKQEAATDTTDADVEAAQMAAFMGIGGFGSTKGAPVKQ